MKYIEIDKRYSTLANDNCCLSCGSALSHAKPEMGYVCVDLGSGRGTDVLRLAEQVGEKGFIYGIDISDGMIEKARDTAKKMGIINVQFYKSELENLPIEDKSADLVISNCTINHASDKQKVWFEVARILKNGGRFVISDIYAVNPVPDEYRQDPVAIAECWAGAVTRNEYLEHLRIAGFSDIEIIEESMPYEKGKVEVSSFTIMGKIEKCCCS
jgi:arsenite methyltransferase